jgi:hypothetical protein
MCGGSMQSVMDVALLRCVPGFLADMDAVLLQPRVTTAVSKPHAARGRLEDCPQLLALSTHQQHPCKPTSAT